MAHTMVIFGASGDLTSRKLIPALFRLFQRGKLPPNSRIVGVSRSDFNSEAWREQLRISTSGFLGADFDAQAFNAFAEQVHYFSCDINNANDFPPLADFLGKVEGGEKADRVYYVATMPQLYETTIVQLGASGMACDSQAARRIVLEKPFGTNLETARKLNQTLQKVFREDQVYRIDHYLGKETVQNILVLRFANSIFEPIWNRNFIDHIQITVAESVTVGRRADYYDRSGVLRDMFQNHLFQLLMVTAMESPARFTADLVRDEKVKVLRSVRDLVGGDFANCGVRGQYAGYLKENGVAAESPTESFAALKLHIDNWRWKGVPFYLRSGKGLSCRTTQIVVEFKEPPHILFGKGKQAIPQANRLVIQIQPAEGIQLHFQSKVPDAEMKIRQSQLDFRFDGTGNEKYSDAYQRLLLDALLGDASLFARNDEVELAWRIIDPIIAAWRSPAAPELHTYPIGGWGPDESGEWMDSQLRSWFDVCPVISG
ncbi:MAG: glucose-6-phosphate dehydrogenase [Planctomycetales bacterium]|nr:glucose-6-phosphate dehydrogenase [Planctomycetales bacterium]